MSAFVVDTNVPIAANGRNTHVREQCRLTCIERLQHVIENDLIAIDKGGEILAEYANTLNWSGAPGIGDVFFKHVFNHQYQPKRVRRVAITPTNDDDRGYEELSSNQFDRSDRKFLATAVVGKATVLNATDSDWQEHHDLVASLGVTVCELCPSELKDTRQKSTGSDGRQIP